MNLIDYQTELLNTNQEYKNFCQKFEPKKTTDECYTPENVYNVIKDFCVKRYKIDESSIIRPFFPGGCYIQEDYTNKVVIDNPPFSILSNIIKFYIDNNIKFVLFCDSKTCCSFLRKHNINLINFKPPIIYENGVRVHTSLVHNFDDEYKILYSTELEHQLKETQESPNKKPKTERDRNHYTSLDLITHKLNIKQEKFVKFVNKNSNNQQYYGGAIEIKP